MSDMKPLVVVKFTAYVNVFTLVISLRSTLLILAKHGCRKAVETSIRLQLVLCCDPLK